MASAAFNAHELSLEQDEAKLLAGAVAAVADHYPMTVDPKTMAWINLVMACGSIYGPRFYLIKRRLDQEAKAAERKDNVIDIAGVYAGSSAGIQ